MFITETHQLGLIFSKRLFRKFWMRTMNILLSIVEVVTAMTKKKNIFQRLDGCNHIRNVETKD